MTNLLEMLSVDQTEEFGCPDCGAPMKIGVVGFKAVWECTKCECKCIDGRSDLITDELLSPREIRRIRANHLLSRREFARLTGFGEATIKRWEMGKLRQNRAANRFLILIRLDESLLEKLKVIASLSEK